VVLDLPDARGHDGMQQRDQPHHNQRGDEHCLEHRLIVAAADEAPQPLVLPERRQ
jgi:hypothetical protein